MAWLRTVSTMGLWDRMLKQWMKKPTISHSLNSAYGDIGGDLSPFKRATTLLGKLIKLWPGIFFICLMVTDDEKVKVFDTCLILHADHELNCSAFPVV